MYLIKAVMEKLPDVKQLQIMVKVNSTSGEWVKAATITVKREQYSGTLKSRTDVDRFQTWYHRDL